MTEWWYQMWGDAGTPLTCPRGPHRAAEGPNEEDAICPNCAAMDWQMRPWGETYGWHLHDCSLPIWHERRCEPGGAGHPEAPNICGYWPNEWRGSPDDGG